MTTFGRVNYTLPNTRLPRASKASVGENSSLQNHQNLLQHNNDSSLNISYNTRRKSVQYLRTNHTMGLDTEVLFRYRKHASPPSSEIPRVIMAVTGSSAGRILSSGGGGSSGRKIHKGANSTMLMHSLSNRTTNSESKYCVPRSLAEYCIFG